ncbi:MAG TPA: hypothetical protein PKL77_10720 [Candidatus Omnitrophota bacterium]|nr:hypothetical protein [Candidatus Omnitrophota bacterium]
MDNKVILAQDRLIERIGNICAKFGLNDFIAQLFAVLYLSKKPLSLDDLTQRLKVSKGNVSINIRVLENWGAVRRIWIKGSRKDFYEAEPNIKKVFAERLKSSLHKRISEVNSMIAEFNDIISVQDNTLSKEDKETLANFKLKLKKVEELNKWASTMLNLVGKLVK